MSDYILYRTDDDVLCIPIEAAVTPKQRAWLESNRHSGYNPKLHALSCAAYNEYCHLVGRKAPKSFARNVLKRNKFQYKLRQVLTRWGVI